MPLPRGKDSGRITDKQEVIRELRSDGPPMPGRRCLNLRISQLRRRRTAILQSLSRRAMVGINYPPVLNEIPSLLFPQASKSVDLHAIPTTAFRISSRCSVDQQ